MFLCSFVFDRASASAESTTWSEPARTLLIRFRQAVRPRCPSSSFDASNDLLGEKDPVPLLSRDLAQDVRIDKLVYVLLSGTPRDAKKLRGSCCRHRLVKEEVID